ncbi:MAG: TSUP family transporter [Clostridia bacterium]|nr:TSUP family transporter [Clostridia bacterium]
MSFFVLLLLGFLGGIPAGMGMGGGTVTIPLLTLFGGVEQKIAQSANLVSFVPAGLASLYIHGKNGLLKTQGAWLCALPAAALSLPAAILANILPGSALSKAFGAFLLVLSFITFSQAKNA